VSFLRHRQIYQPMSLAKAWRRNRPGSVSTPIGSMSLQLAIPWQVALLQSLPPLHQPTSFSRQPAETVNRHHHKVGEFSPSRMRNFQPALTTRHYHHPRELRRHPNDRTRGDKSGCSTKTEAARISPPAFSSIARNPPIKRLRGGYHVVSFWIITKDTYSTSKYFEGWGRAPGQCRSGTS